MSVPPSGLRCPHETEKHMEGKDVKEKGKK
jgi:hypothetical protein